MGADGRRHGIVIPPAIRDLSDRGPLLLIFLRHFGCTFCRQALEDVARVRADLLALGTQVAFVHMQDEAEADHWFQHYGLADVPRFSDPSHGLYRAFGLGDGSLIELGHPRLWPRWAKAAWTRGAGPQGSHWRQLTGMFLINGGHIIDEIRHANSAARPNYAGFVQPHVNGRYNT